MAWSALTHRMHNEWKDLGLRGHRLLILLSGGEDSVALFEVARALSAPHEFQLAAGHVHHGPGENLEFRDQALVFCRELCLQHQVPFFEAKSPRRLRSEAELREFRRACALNWAAQEGFDRLLVAHHAQDLLETRVFRLLRGTGARGLIAMRSWVAPWWRPFLEVSKEEIRAHLAWRKSRFLEDPSNVSTDPTRNWLRHELFPRIEAKRPGALRRLAGSLENMAQELSASTLLQETDMRQGISRTWLLTLSVSQQKRALAQYLWSLGQRNFRHTQLEEIRKRLDNPQSEHRFSLAGCDWVLNAGQIQAFPRADRA